MPPGVTAMPATWRRIPATLDAGMPRDLFKEQATATARGPRWEAAAPRASVTCSGWRGWMRLRHLRHLPTWIW